MVWVADPVFHESQDLTWYSLVLTSLSMGSLSGSFREGKCSKGGLGVEERGRRAQAL